MTDAAPDVLVISGPAGVDKTTLAHEVSRLRADGVGLRWVSAAVPGAVFTCVRLTASPDTLGERILRREVGTGAADQLERTMAQFASLGRPGDDVHAVSTDGRSPREMAAAVIALWRPAEWARA